MTRESSVRHPAAPGVGITNRSGSKGNPSRVSSSSQPGRAKLERGGLERSGNPGSEPHAEPGDWVPPQTFDEYRLIRLLGRGSMGSVYLAHDDVLDRPVAVKFIGNVAPDAEDRDRFLVEARAVARIQHPNVMVIYRVGELEGHPFLITEYIRGKSLSELTVPLPWRKVLELGIGLARGLATAHRMGVLHRDIKLANAVLGEGGEVKLLDFSLAKQLKKGPVVLYFFPAAFTPGCTVEANQFAEATPEFRKLGATVVGMSADPVETLAKFSTSECRSKFAVASASSGESGAAFPFSTASFAAWARRGAIFLLVSLNSGRPGAMRSGVICSAPKARP